MRIARSTLMAAALLLMARPAAAIPVLINFDDLQDLESVTTQFAGSGITFGNTITLGGSGGSLNEFDFPPLSGFNVVSDDGGAITVNFGTSASIVRGHFTYVAPITITAYNGATVLGSVTSLFSENTAFGPNPANELLELVFPEITSLTISGLPGGGSFTLDDFFADVAETRQQVPEPGTAALVLLGLGMAASRRWRGRRA